MSALMKRLLPLAAVMVVLSACVSPQPQTILSEKSAVELRSMQSRIFETGDKGKVFRAVIATFQDLGYTITKVEPAAGTVSADKLAMLKISAAVYPRGEGRTVVRSNAVVKMTPQAIDGNQVDAPEFYQQRFFEPLSKALFLAALQIEDPAGMDDIAAPEVKVDEPAKSEAKSDDAATSQKGTNE